MKPTRIPARSLLLLLALAVSAHLGVAGGGKEIDPNYLSITDCPGEPGCPAIVLLDERELIYDYQRTRYKVRCLVKAFTAEGVSDYSDAEIGTMEGGWSLSRLSGRTILPDGTEILLDQDNIREKTLKLGKRKVLRKAASFRGVVPGSLVEYAYELETRPGTVVTGATWDLQRGIPVLNARFKLERGPYALSWATTGLETLNYTYTDDGFWREFMADNVPSIPREPFAPSEEALGTRFYFYLGDLRSSWIESMAGRWAGRAGAFIGKASGVGAKLRTLISPADAPIIKVEKIYRFVQEQILTEEHRLEMTRRGGVEEAENAGDVLARGFGDEFERTMLFLALVKEAGLEHGLLLIESRERGMLNDKAPDEDQFDSFAAAVRTGENWTFYDPASPHCPFGMISAEKEGGQYNAILVTPDRKAGKETLVTAQRVRFKTNEGAPFEKAKIPFSPASRNVLLREATMKLGLDGVIEAKVTERGSGLVDLDHRHAYERLQSGERVTLLQKNLDRVLPGWGVSDASFEDLESFQKPATIKYQVRGPAEAVRAGDRLVVAPSLFGAGRRNAFTATERRAPVHFPHTQSTQDRIHLELPEGYAIDTLPPPSRIQEGPLALSIAFTEDEGGIEVLRLLVIDAAAWPAADYPRLKTFFEKVQEADRQVVVLKKEAAS